jgi:CTD kinase subunit beta
MAPAVPIPFDAPGPHPSFIQVAKPFLFESKIKSQIILTGTNPAREDSFRLQGIQWIDEVRRAMQLYDTYCTPLSYADQIYRPVRTFNTAAIYYHKFRLVHKDTEYQYLDAAAAALFTACKIEDTLKKSREILCAAANLKLPPSEQLTPDDQVFASSSATIIGLERLMLEASGFDYRNRYPQKLLIKLAAKCSLSVDVTKTSYKMLLDLYRTFSPLKANSATMAFACLELTTRLMEKDQEKLRSESAPRPSKWKTTRQQIMEAMLDLLDLYTHYPKQSLLGQKYSIDQFIKIRITLNQEADERKLARYADSREGKPNGVNGRLNGHIRTPKTPITPASPAEIRNGNGTANANSPATLSPRSSGSGGRKGIGARGQEGTVRFMLDEKQAKREKAMVSEYFKQEYEEYEVEIDAPEEPRNDHRYKNGRDERHGGGRYDRDPKRPRR